MNGSIVEYQNDRLSRYSRLWPEVTANPLQQGDEICAAFGGGGFDDQLSGHGILNPEHGHLAGLTWSLDTQVRSLLGPSVSQIGMSQRLGFVLKQQDNVTGCGLLFQELEP